MGKISKKELRKDPVRDFILKILGEFLKKKERLWWGLGILVILILFSLYKYLEQPRKSPQAEVMFLQAVTLFANNDTINSIQLFENIRKSFPKTPEGKKALYYLGVFNHDKGFLDEGEKYLREFIKSKSKDKLLECFAYMRLGDINLDKGNKGKALEYYGMAQKTAPIKSLEILATLKKVRGLRFNGEYKKAYDELTRFKERVKNLGLFTRDFQEEEGLLKGYLLLNGLLDEGGSK